MCRAWGQATLTASYPILTGIPSPETFSGLTGGPLLELRAEDLKPIIEARPELMEALSRYLAKMQQFLAGSSDLRSSRS